jgi:hypothetical protein
MRISAREVQNETNTWIDYKKEFTVDKLPKEIIARIACDSKYWMWINGELAVFEGQLKRGPSPTDTYYDEVDISQYVKEGNNSISILLWYFGKDGFSHKSSGMAGLAFEAEALGVVSNSSWKARLDKAFDDTGRPKPNFRLPESNIKFDARIGNFDWVKPGANLRGFGPAKVIGEAESAPWNNLIKRPIPLWKNYGLKRYENLPILPFVSSGDTIVCKLSYNAHVTPYFEVEAESGQTIKIQTDHYAGGGPVNVRGEYITREGKQKYENLGWMNGHEVHYIIPKGVKVLDLKYRETGYNSEFSGSFWCDDPFFNKLWEKAVRTLYVTMRDTYMDCPDRERSQWWGDMVVESGETFYALSPESHLLTKKGILELINWQRKDSTIFSPVPSGNWDKELPGQMLSSIGYFGFWNYYWNTGDIETIQQVYEGVGRYLGVWKLDRDGVLKHRSGGWYWGDWGTNADKPLLINEWYYLALEGYKRMSIELGKFQEARSTDQKMKEFKQAFNKVFWKGDQYRSNDYNGEIDDRSQALAVVAGLADVEKYSTIYNLLQTQKYASPYMEKYVIEALFLMNRSGFGLKRLKERFTPMVNNTDYTTLWEGWGIGRHGYGGGSTNHAWSGGGLTILSQYVAGVYPLEKAWSTFLIKPELASLNHVKARIPSVKGEINLEIQKKSKTYTINVSVPKGSNAVVKLPKEYKSIFLNGKKIFANGVFEKNENLSLYKLNSEEVGLKVPNGEYTFVGKLGLWD